MSKKRYTLTDWEWDLIKMWRNARKRFRRLGESAVIKISVYESERAKKPMKLAESIQQVDGPLTRLQRKNAVTRIRYEDTNGH